MQRIKLFDNLREQKWGKCVTFRYFVQIANDFFFLANKHLIKLIDAIHIDSECNNYEINT